MREKDVPDLSVADKNKSIIMLSSVTEKVKKMGESDPIFKLDKIIKVRTR